MTEEVNFLLRLKDEIDLRIHEKNKQERESELRSRFTLVYSATNPYVAENYALKEKVAQLTAQLEEKGEMLQKTEKSISEEKQKLKEIKTDMFKLSDCVCRKKGNGYEIRFRKLGIEKSKSAVSKKEAERKMQSYLNALNKELFGICETLKVNEKPEVKTFIDIADFFIYNVKKENLKPMSFKTLNNRYRLYVREKYKNCTFSELTPMRLQEDLKRIKDKHSRTYEDVRSVLNGIFKYAKANGLIQLNPIEAVFLQKHRRVQGTALTLEEEKRLLTETKNKRALFSFVLMLYAGARPSEVYNTVVDFKTEKITIKNSKLKEYQTNYYRELPLFPMLKPYEKLLKTPFTQHEEHYLNRVLQHVLPNKTLKDLRHTFASRAKECGCNPEVVNVWQGHVAGGDMTAKVYTHYSFDYQKKQAELFIYEV